MNIKLDKMNWPEKLYQFTKVQGAITTYTFKCERTVSGTTFGVYSTNYNQTNWIYQSDLHRYHTSLESCYIAWIESIEKFKQKVIKQFENKCGVKYFDIAFSKLVENHNKRRQDEMDKNI